MRLSKLEQSTIIKTVKTLDGQAKIVLFGSRADDDARGGDVDLLIVSDTIQTKNLGEIRWQLWEKLGEQKIDLVLSKSTSLNTFSRLALAQGIELQ